ncbi:MAG: hypothetical protein AB7I37_21580 [Pirellulales bacterium]
MATFQHRSAFVAKCLFTAFAIAALYCAAPHAQAGLFDKIKKGVNKAAQSTATAATSAVNQTKNFGQQAGNEIKTVGQQAGNEVKTQGQALGEQAYAQLKDNVVEKNKDLMRDTATNWQKLISENKNDINAISQAIKNKDGNEAGRRIVNLLKNNGGMKKLVENAQQKKFGSIVFLTSASGAAGVGGSGAVGEAISIDSLVHFFKYGSFPQGKTNASLFLAGGLTVGASGGGSVDAAIGYTMAQPNDVGGPSLDLNVELNLAAGGNTALSFDPTDGVNFSGFTIGAAAGAKFDLSGGVSYTQVLLNIKDPNDPFAR